MADTDSKQISSLKTQGVKYAGSKLKFLPYILNLIETTGCKKILDGFSGTTRVSQALAQNGKQLHANDLSDWSYQFGLAFLKNTKEPKEYEPLINHLNSLAPCDGWFTKHYGGDAEAKTSQDTLKKPWQIHNTRVLDAIRTEIDHLKLDPIDQAVALTSLMLALDEVDNTLGHHSSYLRKWSSRSYKTMQLKVPNLWINQSPHQVTQLDAFEAAAQTHSDFAYYDPPYGSNNEKMPPSRVRYAAYYHLWKTVCLNDKPQIFGKAGRRKDSSDTISKNPFEDFRKNTEGHFVAVEAIDRLLKITNCEWILLSYSSGGRATAEQLNDCIHSHGQLVKNVEIEYQKHVMAAMQSTKNWLKDESCPHREFLILIKKK